MTNQKRLTLLKIEGLFFAVAMIFFTVMYYFSYMTKYLLVSMILMFASVLFSINSTIQGYRNSKATERFNIVLSVLFFMATLGLTIYFYSAGLLGF